MKIYLEIEDCDDPHELLELLTRWYEALVGNQEEEEGDN